MFVASFFILPSVSADNSLLFGQKHYYTAIVRSDKKVATYAKIVLDNQGDKELKQATFSLPDGVRAQNLSVYQIMQPERCVKYEESVRSYSGSDERKCLKKELDKDYNFDQEEYYSYYDSNSRLSYKKADLQSQGGKYVASLPEPIKSGQQGAYLISYIAEGYVHGQFGLYSLEFKTLKAPEMVKQVRVAVDVASDLYTKEKRSKIDYEGAENAIAGGASAANGIQSRELDRLQSDIGNGGTFTKTGKSLAANEVFVVNGQFADAPWKLNIGWIIGGIIGSAVLIVVVIFLLKKAGQEEIVEVRKEMHHGKK